MTQEDPDLTLVQALQDGEDRTLNELMDRHREGLFRFVLRHVHNEADALELAMETFVRAYFNIGKFRPRAKFATWLYQIALNLCRDHLRSRAYQYSLSSSKNASQLQHHRYAGSASFAFSAFYGQGDPGADGNSLTGETAANCYNPSDPNEIKLWEGSAPGSSGDDPCRDIPFLHIYRVSDANQALRPAILLIPGG